MSLAYILNCTIQNHRDIQTSYSTVYFPPEAPEDELQV